MLYTEAFKETPVSYFQEICKGNPIGIDPSRIQPPVPLENQAATEASDRRRKGGPSSDVDAAGDSEKPTGNSISEAKLAEDGLF